MTNLYDVFEFNYYDKESKQGFAVYAREEKTAQEIIDIVNTDNDLYHFVKPRFRKFKAATKTQIPPYTLEQEQIENVNKQLQKRREYYAKHGR